MRILTYSPLLVDLPTLGDFLSRADLELITAFTAKEVCSCRFVMMQSAEYCQAWTKASPAVATFRVNEKHKEVTAAALGLWSATARYISPREGCRLA